MSERAPRLQQLSTTILSEPQAIPSKLQNDVEME